MLDGLDTAPAVVRRRVEQLLPSLKTTRRQKLNKNTKQWSIHLPRYYRLVGVENAEGDLVPLAVMTHATYSSRFL